MHEVVESKHNRENERAAPRKNGGPRARCRSCLVSLRLHCTHDGARCFRRQQLQNRTHPQLVIVSTHASRKNMPGTAWLAVVNPHQNATNRVRVCSYTTLGCGCSETTAWGVISRKTSMYIIFTAYSVLTRTTPPNGGGRELWA